MQSVESNKILFKAKTKDTNKWVLSDSIHNVSPTEIKLWVNGKWVDVIPESVSRFTEMIDKNGVKIFEGDIVRTQLFYDRPYSKSRKGKSFVGEVVYMLRAFRGIVKRPVNQIYEAEWKVKIYEDMGNFSHYSWSNFWECEIIGHKYDNPELLEVNKDDSTTNV